jgi:galactokinase
VTADSTLRSVLARTVETFQQRFARRPRWAACAPGRVNLIGEHTDYNEGFVLPLAIDRWVVVAADLAAGSASAIWAADLGRGATVALGGPLRPDPGSFAGCVLGVVAQRRAAGDRVPELDLALHGSIPIGAGLASSAALEVATATLLGEVVGRPLGALETALLCRRAEHEFAGTPCGIMDMLVAASAVRGHALLIDCRSNRVRPVPLPPQDRAVVLVADTGVRHALASSEYAARRRECEEAARRLGLAVLRDAAARDAGSAALSGAQRRLVRHVLAENERTLLAAAALRIGDLDALGALMFDGHASLRDLYRVSCPELDLLVDAASELRADGVIGARMTGGGFGGCVVALVATPAVSGVTAHLRSRFAQRFGRLPGVFATPAVGAARSLAP